MNKYVRAWHLSHIQPTSEIGYNSHCFTSKKKVRNFFFIERSYLLGVNWNIIAEILKTHLIDRSSYVNKTPMNGFVMKLSKQFECLLYKLSCTNSLISFFSFLIGTNVFKQKLLKNTTHRISSVVRVWNRLKFNYHDRFFCCVNPPMLTT